MPSGCLCLDGTNVKAQECLWSSVSSVFCLGFGRSLCAWLLERRRSGSWIAAEGSCPNSLIFLRSCPFCGHLYPRCCRIGTLPLCGQHMVLQSLRESVSMAAWEDDYGLAPKAGRHVPSCMQGILLLCAALSLLEPPPLPWTLNQLHHPPDSSWALCAAPSESLDTSHMAPPLLAVPYSPCTLAFTCLCPFVKLSHNEYVHEKGKEVRMLMGLLSLSLLPR